ncbi:hypothetical protein [Micromonospora endolithica]|uniref:Uncharacterized protein n=1 Tax=Micromonospora endolithica TaxID=230091 RepID=A0A3A9ZM70_9ACTN|nr:hypothetical protein [Micromonospora endolithica]RKN49422.1 hypothetical protein D7223_07985 [Micromonospora endolithica]TWJ23618.1 hypothetical protein JD76_03757 [Micromonospora endolithica]
MVLAVVAVWALAAGIGVATWLAAGEDRQPETAGGLVAGTVLPGLLAVAIAYALTRFLERRRADRRPS